MRPAPICFREDSPIYSGSWSDLHALVMAWAKHHAKCGRCRKHDWYNPSVDFNVVAVGERAKEKWLEGVAKIAKNDQAEAERTLAQLQAIRIGNWRVWYRSLWPLESRLCAPVLQLFMRWAVTAGYREEGKAVLA